ncbi:MAG: 2-oxo acid dehydrogenase subunit E2 [Candidatus Saccharimonas sp.]|nr:2-oxo acid dehydrogenase subunit E2 [Planctomycetaceae bacterium]
MAHEIVIPRLGWSMEEGTFVGWLKKDGDLVRRGDAVFELEGEKASQDIEAVDEGILRIPPTGPKPGSLLKVGAVVGYLVAAGEPIPGAAALLRIDSHPPVDSPLPPAAAPSVRRLAREAGVALSQLAGTGPGGRVMPADVHRASPAPSPGATGEGLRSPVFFKDTGGPRQPPVAPGAQTAFASPRARRVAFEVGIDWTRLSGTGAGGRVRESDVRAAAARGPSSARSNGDGQRLPLTSRRRVIAQRMVASRQQTVPVTLTTKADATNLVNLREQFKAVGGSTPIPSYQDIITKLGAEVLKRHPLLAGRWDEDAVVLPAADELHLGMAVDTEEGLLVPVIRNVGRLPLNELAGQSRRLADQARAGKLVAADMQGGVFTITNLGAFGIDAFTPIINLPEVAILGLGTIRREPIVLDDGQIVARQQLTLSLTFDHRIVDGAPAARFLQDVVHAIANPSAWLLS